MSSSRTAATPRSRISPITLVGRHGAAYACPDIAAVDRHLQALHERITNSAPAGRQLVQNACDDIDLLLDRRLRLEREQRGDSA